MSYLRRSFAAIALLVTGTASGATYEITAISITDLGTLGGAESVGRDINNFGDVVGWAHAPDGRRHAFLHWRGAMQDISAGLEGYETEATGVNRHTEIVGTARSTADPRQMHGTYYWVGGTLLLVDDRVHPDVDVACDYISSANAISDYAMAVGIIGLLSGDARCLTTFEPAYWSGPFFPNLIDSGIAGGTNHDVNSLGQVAGRSNEIGGVAANAAYRWSGGTFTSVPLPVDAVFRPGASSGTARGINEAGHVVGEFSIYPVTGAKRAFFWDGTSPGSRNLGLLPTGTTSAAFEVNEQDFVVGIADRFNINPLPGPAGYRRNAGFIWHASFGMRELPKLPTSGYSGSCEAYAVNRISQWGTMQVVGFCTSGARKRAVRWEVSTRVVAPCPFGLMGSRSFRTHR
jgi:probable HAF family extracellular repeat protein